MKELKKNLGFIIRHPERAPEFARRLIRRIVPPEETKVHAELKNFPVIFTKTGEAATARQPKQVIVTPDRKTALVSSMTGRKLQMFDAVSLTLTDELDLPQACVEINIMDNLCLATTSNFHREPPLENFLWIIDIETKQIISSVETGGNWSKVIAISPDHRQVLISNWESNSISVIDISDPKHPQVIQQLPLHKSPRGIAFTSDGQTAIVANFYSGNIAELKRKGEKWDVAFISPPFDYPRHPGNPRHVLISSDNRRAFVSNKGRNLLHIWSIPERRFTDCVLVGKSPNSIDFLGERNDKIIVSCSGTDRICLVDTKTLKIVGVSPKTGKVPTGLGAISKSEFLVTGFDSNTLEKFTLTSQTN